MAKLTFNLELSRNVAKSTGMSHVLLRIQDDQHVKKRISTGIDVNPKNWSMQRQKVKPSDSEYVVKNSKLQDFLDQAEAAKNKLIEAGEIPDAVSVASVFKGESKPHSFMQFAEMYFQRFFDTGELREYKKHKSLIVKLKFFVNGFTLEEYAKAPRMDCKEFPEFAKTHLTKDLPFASITPTFVENFSIYLKGMPNMTKKGHVLSIDTVKKHIAMFRACYRKGLHEQNLQFPTDPFYGLKFEKSNVVKAKLTMEEIDQLNDLELESNSLSLIARDCFMFSFYCAGIRCGDVLRMRGTNIYKEGDSWRLQYEMGKTGKQKDMKLQLEALAILTRYVDFNHLSSDYIFPLLDNDAPYAIAKTNRDIDNLPPHVKRMLIAAEESNNSLLNKFLLKIAKMAGVEKRISMHISRHSFADLARRQGASVYDVKQALGHSSLKITEKYLASFDTASQDATLDSIFHRTSEEENLITAIKRYSLVELNNIISSIGYKVVTL